MSQAFELLDCKTGKIQEYEIKDEDRVAVLQFIKNKTEVWLSAEERSCK